MTTDDLNVILKSPDIIILGKTTKINLILRVIIPLTFDDNNNIAIYNQFKRIYNTTDVNNLNKSTKFTHVDMGISSNIGTHFYDLLLSLKDQGYIRLYLPSTLVEI